MKSLLKISIFALSALLCAVLATPEASAYHSRGKRYRGGKVIVSKRSSCNKCHQVGCNGGCPQPCDVTTCTDVYEKETTTTTCAPKRLVCRQVCHEESVPARTSSATSCYRKVDSFCEPNHQYSDNGGREDRYAEDVSYKTRNGSQYESMNNSSDEFDDMAAGE